MQLGERFSGGGAKVSDLEYANVKAMLGTLGLLVSWAVSRVFVLALSTWS